MMSKKGAFENHMTGARRVSAHDGPPIPHHLMVQNDDHSSYLENPFNVEWVDH